MKNFTFLLITLAVCLFCRQQAFTQVKTKIFDNGIPASMSRASYQKNEVHTPAPANLETLKKSRGESESAAEYKNRFAVPVAVDYDLLQMAKQSAGDDGVIYSLKLVADKALNLSLAFSEFELSPNAVLSIATDRELTDSITAKENNPGNIWATRIYQGDFVYLTLMVPRNEATQNRIKINQVNFGFVPIGGEFYGNPGASAPCNINVLCAQGNGWENERTSVALIVSGGATSCTGTLVMNTCGTNIPYLLTANHCLDANVSNWVFQFQTWSSTCVPNGTYRQDLQFNGCQLRANNAASDFALVQLNQVPQVNSGITYSGWDRNANAATSGTSIHHPRGDLMKISTFNQAATAVSWMGGAANHWRVSFDQGIVQHGSSGSALYDQNHRLVGQLHGNQNNNCGLTDNNCWCTTQIPSIGEYGRFDISWAGGGTNATRLSNWLDPNNLGFTTTNTTNISNLASPTGIYKQIVGPDYICNTASYSIQNLPPGFSVAWQVLQGTTVVSSSVTGNTLNLTKTGDGFIEIDAVITNNGGCTTAPTQFASKKLIVGLGAVGGFWLHGQNFDYTATGPGNYYTVCPNEYLWFEPYYGTAGNPASAHIWTFSGSGTLLSSLNGPTISAQAPSALRTGFNITYQYLSACGGWSNIANGGATTMDCAGGEEPYSTRAINSADVKVYPNPSSNNYVLIRLATAVKSGNASLFDVSGRQVLIENFSGLQKTLTTSKLAGGTYVLRLILDGQVTTTKVVIQK